ncbi:cytochrome P450 93A3-like [Henckelia pumila]|uniref:cytochrome P450 93A3-like n=1 Tax=Henckelia pumila TaxID=405737 RepID=UPI003C6E179E
MTKIQQYTGLFLICLISTILIRAIFKNKRSSKRRLPPSPLALPIIRHLHLLAPIPHQALAKLASRYGPLFHIYLGYVPCIVVSSQEMAKEVLKTHESSFSDRPQTVASDYVTYGSQDFTFAPHGPYWKFIKKLCMSELLGGQTLDFMMPIRRSEMRHLVELLLKSAESGTPVDVGKELIRMTNNVISRMMMSQTCSGDESAAGEARKLIRETAELVGKVNVSDYIWFCKNLDLQGFGKRLKDVRDKFDEFMEKIIEEHQNARRSVKLTGTGEEVGSHVKDLLHILLDISEDKNSEIKLTKENIKAFILDIFVAGTDTTATTMEWALSELINHPNIMRKAVQEIDTIVGHDKLVEESDISNLPYIQAIVKETLRLHPAGPLIGRVSSKDCTIGNYHIPSKTRLYVNVWAIGRDASHWENALEFRPERFLNDDGSVKGQLDVRGQIYHLLPFGSGRRGCPGTSLALQVVQTTLAAMIRCFEWKVHEGGNGVVDMEEGVGLVLKRANPLVCFPAARLHSIPFGSV